MAYTVRVSRDNLTAEDDAISERMLMNLYLFAQISSSPVGRDDADGVAQPVHRLGIAADPLPCWLNKISVD